MNTQSKQLKMIFDLDCKVTVYVPSTFDIDKVADNSAIVEKVQKDFSDWFGGCTATDAVGCWVMMAGKLVTESVRLCMSFCTSEQLKIHIEDVLSLCEWIKKTMKQEAVTLEINGQVKFV